MLMLCYHGNLSHGRDFRARVYCFVCVCVCVCVCVSVSVCQCMLHFLDSFILTIPIVGSAIKIIFHLKYLS